MNAIEESDADEDRGSNEENEKEKADTRSAKDAMAHDATVGTAVDCNNVLTFFQVAFRPLEEPACRAFSHLQG